MPSAATQVKNTISQFSFEEFDYITAIFVNERVTFIVVIWIPCIRRRLLRSIARQKVSMMLYILVCPEISQTMW
ncbi:hypothetical protein C448_05998 [Halococcus morrhuae DSM 1307]|uniref:Uncharacterized protein n=1 Tax=Halococcus morrhuae DSM 1307 TaxID=931277 RepID=M0MLU8_HALMO|nr:hypothetical protein C448_05998 [Halococcus morrhuae DSM 1307]